MYLPRLQTLRDLIGTKSFNGLIVSKRENIHYLTGLNQVHPTNREALLFLTQTATFLYHSAFLTPPRHSFLKSLPMSAANPLEKVLQSIYRNHNLAVEAHNLTVAEYNRIHQSLPNCKLTPTTDLIEHERQIKDQFEIESIKKASEVTQKTMSWIKDYLINRLADNIITEIALSHLIEQKLYKFGANSLAFPVIVAFDQNSALPHHIPDKTKLKSESVVLLDFGCMVKGYASDMTRTFCLGTPPPHYTEIEKVVKSAYTAGLKLLRNHFTVSELTGDRFRIESVPDPKSRRLTAANLDIAVRSVIDKAGYGKEFIHTTGHSLGLEIHEQPSLNSANQMELKPNMVITLEPGIYLPGQFGYRHENTLLIC